MQIGTVTKTLKSGKIARYAVHKCTRCGGTGIYRWWTSYGQAAGTCFRCGGDGKDPTLTRIWSEEEKARNAKRAETRRVNKALRGEALESFASAVVANVAEIVRTEAARLKAEAEAARKTVSQHVGAKKERLTLELTLVARADWDDAYGNSITLYIMRDDSGNKFTWKTSGWLRRTNDEGFEVRIDRGETFKCKATVKDHSEYRDEKQTVLTRLKVAA